MASWTPTGVLTKTFHLRLDNQCAPNWQWRTGSEAQTIFTASQTWSTPICLESQKGHRWCHQHRFFTQCVNIRHNLASMPGCCLLMSVLLLAHLVQAHCCTICAAWVWVCQQTCRMIRDLLIHPLQSVRLGSYRLLFLTVTTGAPQGCELSPMFQTLYSQGVRGHCGEGLWFQIHQDPSAPVK